MTTVLVIEDDDAFRKTIDVALRAAGHTVVAIADGRHAAAALRDHAIDLVVTDILMPGQEGLATIMELRRTRPDVPIIAMSGGGRGEAGHYLDLAAKFGAAITLEKPFTPEQLRDAVTRLIPAEPRSS